MPPDIRQPTAFDITRLLLVGAIWGSSFLFIALALEGFGPVTIAALRVVLAAAMLAAVGALMKQAMPATPGDWWKLTVIGLFNSALPFFLIGWGQQFVSGAESALLVATGTFFALLLSHFSTRDERINLARGIGVSVGFCGVLVLVMDELLRAGPGAIKGQLAIMLAGASYAGSAVLARRVAYLPPLSATAAMMLTASAYMLPLALLLEPLGAPNTPAPGLSAALSVLCLGLLATALGFVVRFAIIRDNGAVFMSQAGYLVPLFGVIWSYLFLAAPVTAKTWTALALILLGIAVTRRGSGGRGVSNAERG